ncbi:hypothetical protein FALBO_13647 [Fusarium albosuccineum]|uniref:Uncharacterized protein n=1 Tax=Fusarium albosuccineum TaxID=1237068 RepID=A0A8H4KYE4_9HYPO|nr:hypothetical protein FALBO_13647 [Fusarium albosuccineum]
MISPPSQTKTTTKRNITITTMSNPAAGSGRGPKTEYRVVPKELFKAMKRAADRPMDALPAAPRSHDGPAGSQKVEPAEVRDGGANGTQSRGRTQPQEGGGVPQLTIAQQALVIVHEVFGELAVTVRNNSPEGGPHENFCAPVPGRDNVWVGMITSGEAFSQMQRIVTARSVSESADFWMIPYVETVLIGTPRQNQLQVRVRSVGKYCIIMWPTDLSSRFSTSSKPRATLTEVVEWARGCWLFPYDV